MSLVAGQRPSGVPCDPPTTAVVLLQGDTELDEWPLAAGEWPDLALVDYLARLQLAARRHGYSISVRHAPPALGKLLRLAGLATVVPVTGDA